MTEIQGKSILVQVSTRFELARVRVVGNLEYKTTRTLFSLYLFSSSSINQKGKSMIYRLAKMQL